MRKPSFETEVAKQIASGLINSGWQKSDNSDIYWKPIDEDTWLVVTLTNGSKQYRGQPLGQLYVPRVFLIHNKIEAAYDEWCANSGGSPLFLNQAGTLWIAPNFYRLGCPEFYNKKFPLVKAFDSVYNLEAECKNTSAHTAYALSDHNAYLFQDRPQVPATAQEPPTLISLLKATQRNPNSESEGSPIFDSKTAALWLMQLATSRMRLPNSTGTDANGKIPPALLAALGAPQFSNPTQEGKNAHEEKSEQVAGCIKDINGAGDWLLERAATNTKLLDFAASASHDINTALFFGPAWPFRIPQLLLAAGRTDDALKFKDFLERMQWAGLLRLNSKLATERMNKLFDYYSRSDHRVTATNKIDRNLYLEKFAHLIKKVPAKASDPNDRVQAEWAIFGGGLPGLFTGIDKSLYRLP